MEAPVQGAQTTKAGLGLCGAGLAGENLGHDWWCLQPPAARKRRDLRIGHKGHRLGERLRLTDSLDDLHRNMASTWIEPETVMAGNVSEPPSHLDDPLPAFGADDPAMRMMLQDMRSYMPDDILCKVDRAAMGVSLETRTPFLDPDVIALAARLPMAMKIRDGQGKWALRQVLYQHVPREMIERPKAGLLFRLGYGCVVRCVTGQRSCFRTNAWPRMGSSIQRLSARHGQSTCRVAETGLRGSGRY